MLHKSNKDILNGNITEQLLLFAYPIIAANLLTQVYQVVDKIILGRLVSVEALAAVGGSATTIMNCVLNFISGLSVAVTVFVAQYCGRGNRDKVVNTIKTSMFIAVVFGGMLTVVGCLSARPLLNVMGVPEETKQASLTYLYFYYASMIPYIIYMFGVSILRATGDAKRPFYFVAIIAVVKIFFDIILAGLFKLGVVGTSLSTFISYLVCGLIIVCIFMHTSDFYQYNIFDFGFDKELLPAMLKMGIPSGLQTFMFSLSVLTLQIKLNKFGTKMIAAYSVYTDVENVYWNITGGLGTALITVVGQNFGRKNYHRVKKIISTALIMDAIISIIMSLFCVFIGPKFASVFSTDKEVLQYATTILRTNTPFFILYIMIEVYSCSMKACGESTQTMLISLIGIVIIRNAYIILMPVKNISQLVFVYPLTWLIAGLMFTIYFLVTSKKRFKTE